MEFKIKDYKPDTLAVELYPVLLCQLNCPFCYARQMYARDWGQYMSLKLLRKTLNSLISSKYEINLHVLGGEPFLYPYLDEILKCSDRLKINIITNGLCDFRKYNIKNVSLCMSYYPKYTDLSKFMSNLEYARKITDVELHIAKFKNENTYYVENYCEKNGIRIEYVPLLDKHNKIINDGVDFSDDASIYLLNGTPISSYEVASNNISFKGCNCEQVIFYIDVKGNVYQGCKGVCANINSNPSFFKNYEIHEIVCERDYCNDTFLGQRKYK